MEAFQAITLALELCEKLGETWERVWPILSGRLPELADEDIPDLKTAYERARQLAKGDA